jgi:hypothetical protein
MVSPAPNAAPPRTLLAAIEGALAEGRGFRARLLAEQGATGPHRPSFLLLGAIGAMEAGDAAGAAGLLRGAAAAEGVAPAARLLGRCARVAGRQGMWAELSPLISAFPAKGDELTSGIAAGAAMAGDAGATEAALAQIADRALAAETCDLAAGLLAARAGWAAAQPVLARVSAPSPATRGRAAWGALRAGAIAEAVRLVGVPGDEPGLAAAREAVCLHAAAGGLPQEAAALLAFMPAPGFATRRAVVRGLAEAGLTEAARAVVAAAAPGSRDRVALEAVALHGGGELPEARTRLDEAIALAPADDELLSLALIWDAEADDATSMAGHAARLLPLREAGPPGPLIALAGQAAEGGDAATAEAALGAARRRLATLAAEGARGQIVLPALSLFDVRMARDAVNRITRSDTSLHALLGDWEAESAADPALAAFVERAARAHAAGAPDGAAGDLAIIARATLFPSTDTGAGAQPEQEVRAVRRVLARTLAMAEAAGLRCVVVPAAGNVVPDAARKVAPCFVGYHTHAERGAGVHVKLGPLPDAVLIDPSGYSGWSIAAARRLGRLPLAEVDAERAVTWMAEERARLAAGNISKLAQAPRAALDLQGDAVLVALQKPGDAVLRHAAVDMFTLARGVVRAFAGTGTRVVVKRHPRCRDPRTSALLREIAAEPHVTVTDASVHDLLPAVRAVYTVNSGVGAEALLYGRAVHVAGATDYQHACHRIRRPEDIRPGPDAFAPPVKSEPLARYVWWYRNVHCVPLDRPGALDAAIRARIIRPALRRRAEAAPA